MFLSLWQDSMFFKEFTLKSQYLCPKLRHGKCFVWSSSLTEVYQVACSYLARFIKPWPNAFNTPFNIIQRCCIQHVERVWPPILNDVECCWTILKETWTRSNFFSTWHQHYFGSCWHVVCIWPSLASTSFNIVLL